MRGLQIIQCYIPYLSGLQLFGADHTRWVLRDQCAGLVEALNPVPAAALRSPWPALARCCTELPANKLSGPCTCVPCRRIPSPLSGYSSSDEEASCCSSSASSLDAPSDSSSSSVCTSSTASTASVDSDSEADSKDSSGGSGAEDRKAAFRLSARGGDGGSVLRKQHALGEPGNPLFEFFEEESPYARSPLADRIAELAEEFPGLLSLSSSDLHPASWFAVAWYPAYRIPSLADASLSRDLQASLLTFHSVAVPPSLPAELHPHGAAHPIPPPPCAPAAAALAWRSETARQQLIASALSALSGAEAGVEGEGEAGQPSQQPPVSVACLRPFAFMPYKVGCRAMVCMLGVGTGLCW